MQGDASHGELDADKAARMLIDLVADQFGLTAELKEKNAA